MKEVLTPIEAKKIFDAANERYFEGKLRPIPIESMCCGGKVAGYSYRKEKGKIVRRVIFVSSVYKIEKDLFESVVVHEMLHYYLHEKYGKNMGHNKVWKKTIAEYNQKYGLHITTRPDPSIIEYIGDDQSIFKTIFMWMLGCIKRLFRK